MTSHCDEHDVRRMSIALCDGAWHLGRTINLPARTVRAIVAARPDAFLSSQAGFKLFRYASDIEIDIACADLKSRILHLQARLDGHESARRERGGQRQLL